MWVQALVLPLLLSVCLVTANDFSLPSPWTWHCEAQGNSTGCVKYAADGLREVSSLDRCKMTCGKHGMLWPKPALVEMGSEVVRFLPQNMNFVYKCSAEVCPLLEQGTEQLKCNMDMYHPDYSQTFHGNGGKLQWAEPMASMRALRDHNVTVRLNVTSPDTRLTLDTDESYELKVNQLNEGTDVAIDAATFFGARHALETLSQLITYDDMNNGLQIVSEVLVKDAPKFKYRGILLDTARNFFTVADIKRTIDGMAANKLNTFHWHITDSHSFPMYLNSLPQMVYYGAYSPRKIYRPEDVREIVEYGRVRGVRVLPEFDAPAHVGNGFQWGELQGLGKLAVCVNKEPWQSYCVEPPCGQLNIANEKMYEVLSKIYAEMAEMFAPIDLFHYGGDEINLNCWNTTEEITKWMTERGNDLSADSYYKEWSVFQDKAEKSFTAANKKEVPGIVWTSELTNKNHVDKYLDPAKYIIQIWTTGKDEIIKGLLEKNFRLIFSNYDAWYFDCGLGAWVGEGNNWCSPYKGWQKVYDNSPREMAGEAHIDKVLGGEAALWSEQVDSTSLDSRLWPRGAALAERLWSDPNHNWESAERRFINHRQRMVERGIKADRVQPEWCHQNENLCYLNKAHKVEH